LHTHESGTVFPGMRLDQAGVGTLSVKELKQLLAHQDIPYRHYIEKKEFREAVGALQALGTGHRDNSNNPYEL